MAHKRVHYAIVHTEKMLVNIPFSRPPSVNTHSRSSFSDYLNIEICAINIGIDKDTYSHENTTNRYIGTQSLSNPGKFPEDTKHPCIQPKDGSPSYPFLFLSMTAGICECTYVQVHINRRITRSKLWKLNNADIPGQLWNKKVTDAWKLTRLRRRQGLWWRFRVKLDSIYIYVNSRRKFLNFTIYFFFLWVTRKRFGLWKSHSFAGNI